MAIRREQAELVEFLRAKYGSELLIDVAWLREMPTFMRKGPHRLAFHDILLVTKGTGRYLLDGHEHQVSPRTVFFTAPHQVRQWDVRGVEGLCLLFPPTFVGEFLSDGAFLSRLPYFGCGADVAALQLDVRSAADLKRRLLEMRREFAALRADSEHVLRAGLHGALIQLARVYARQHPRPTPAIENTTTAAFKALVTERVRREHRVAAYAARLRVSPNHLNVLCRRHLGLGAKAVIAEALGVEARRALVVSERSTEAVSADLGFKDPSYFARFFKRITGQSPSTFRRQRQLGRAF